ncbi:MAG: molybdopterin molybdotransferase MoeA [Syntrophobacter sp.]
MDLREAAEIAAGLAAAPREEEIGIESALGRVLARDMAADRDFPGEYRSRWDGYALSGAATSGASHEAPAILAIAAAVVTAGGSAAASPGGSTCFRIMTGAVLPKGTDAVIPFEDAVLSGNQLVLRAPVKRSKGVILPGADAQAGDVLLEKGDVLTPARLALAVAVGANKIHVYKRPRVAILATGDELRATGCDAGGPGVFCNNIPLLAGLVAVGGGEPIYLGIAPDDPEIILDRLRSARADMAVTTGGMGKGSRDFILAVWKRLGVTVHFDSLNISPGKGSALGSAGDRIFLGLPGNPWAAQIVFEEIAAPIIRRLQGARIWRECGVMAKTAVALQRKERLYRTFRGSLTTQGETGLFIPMEETPTRALLPMLRSGLAYTIVGPGRETVPEGGTVEVKIPDFSLSAWAVLNAGRSH